MQNTFMLQMQPKEMVKEYGKDFRHFKDQTVKIDLTNMRNAPLLTVR
jgi:hypothetical protein